MYSDHGYRWGILLGSGEIAILRHCWDITRYNTLMNGLIMAGGSQSVMGGGGGMITLVLWGYNEHSRTVVSGRYCN